MKALLFVVLLTVAACSAAVEEEAPILIVDIETTDSEPTPKTETKVEEPIKLKVKELGMPRFVGTAIYEDINPKRDVVEVNISAEPRKVEVAEGLEFDMFTYNGSFPGPLLEATVGDTVVVHFTNNLNEPTTIHWHGLRISDDMDGNPRIQKPVAPGDTFTYRFVVPDAGTFWYHPHMRTNVQIERGLYGPLVVHEKPEMRPRHDRERFFVLDDILIDGDKIAQPFTSHMELMHGRHGNALVTNGSLEILNSTAAVGERERWRLVNTANARTMKITITGARFVVYGNDGGRIEPFETDELLLPVGQRYDVEVIYDVPGEAILQQLVLVRNANDQIVEEPYDIAVIDVVENEYEATKTTWSAPPVWEDREIDRTETVVLDAVEGGEMGILWRINGKAHAMKPEFEFNKGETVKLRIRNTLGPEHPFHLHGQFFKVVGQPGVWDTILVPGQSTVEIIAFMDNPGEWMMHCHIAEHSAVGMMSSFSVKD